MRAMDLISIAIDTAPLGQEEEVATMMNFEIRPLKLLFTAQLLSMFLFFFMSPPDAAAAYEETQHAIEHGIRALNNKIGDGLKSLVIDGLKNRALRLHLHVHRFELGWAEHRLPTPGEITPVGNAKSKAKKRRKRPQQTEMAAASCRS